MKSFSTVAIDADSVRWLHADGRQHPAVSKAAENRKLVNRIMNGKYDGRLVVVIYLYQILGLHKVSIIVAEKDLQSVPTFVGYARQSTLQGIKTQMAIFLTHAEK